VTCCPGRAATCLAVGVSVPSASVCEDLPDFRFSSSSVVCAASEMGGQCYKSMAFTAAQAACQMNGARLCRMAELQLDMASGTGCGLNTRQVRHLRQYHHAHLLLFARAHRRTGLVAQRVL
jgi:hypothetical protein